MFTRAGRYTARGWTEWTEGFQYGSALLQFDATGEPEFLELGRERTLTRMAPHLTHMGVHDHGFNNVSTYGALWRMAREGRIDVGAWEMRFYELALKVSGAVQARRWTSIPWRRLHLLVQRRALALRRHDPIAPRRSRLRISWAIACSPSRTRRSTCFRVWCSTPAQRRPTTCATVAAPAPFDVRGRVAHESLFNAANGTYRGPSTQQGYSPFSTWTRGLAWAMLGFAEELEFLSTVPASTIEERR